MAGVRRTVGRAAGVLALAGLVAPAAWAGMADVCVRTDTALDAYLAAFAKDGWQVLTGAEAEAAKRTVAQGHTYFAIMQTPSDEKTVQTVRTLAETTARRYSPSMVFLRRDGLLAGFDLSAKGKFVHVLCIFDGDPVPEVQLRLAATKPSAMDPHLRMANETDLLPGNKSAMRSWLSAVDLPDGSGLPRDVMIYSATLKSND